MKHLPFCVFMCLVCWGVTVSAVWVTAASWGWARCVYCHSTTTRSPPWTLEPLTRCTPCLHCQWRYITNITKSRGIQNACEKFQLFLLFSSNLLANPFNCNCHLAWLGDWLRRKRIVTGNPRCQSPYFLKEIPIQDVAVQDFACEEGELEQVHTWASTHNALQHLHLQPWWSLFIIAPFLSLLLLM